MGIGKLFYEDLIKKTNEIKQSNWNWNINPTIDYKFFTAQLLGDNKTLQLRSNYNSIHKTYYPEQFFYALNEDHIILSGFVNNQSLSSYVEERLNDRKFMIEFCYKYYDYPATLKEVDIWKKKPTVYKTSKFNNHKGIVECLKEDPVIGSSKGFITLDYFDRDLILSLYGYRYVI